MRKILCLLLSLLLLSLGCMVFVFSSINSTRDAVSLRETTLFGDLSAAEGLTVRSYNSYLSRLHWATTHVIGKTPITDTAYHTTPDYEMPSRRETSYEYALQLTTSLSGAYYEEGDVTGLSLAYRELYESMGPNESKEMEVLVKDYYDYYPLYGCLELPNFVLDWDHYASWDSWYTEEELALITALETFFRFPILEDDRELIMLELDAAKNVCGSGGGSISGDDFFLRTYTPYTDEAIFIAFDAHTNNGDLIDTSLIPGGFGIYRLPYHETTMPN